MPMRVERYAWDGLPAMLVAAGGDAVHAANKIGGDDPGGPPRTPRLARPTTLSDPRRGSQPPMRYGVKVLGRALALAAGGALFFLRAWAVFGATVGSPAAFTYPPLETAPPVAATLTEAQLVAILDESAPNTPYASVYGLRGTAPDGTKLSAAPLKIAQTDLPQTPYIGVFHTALNATQFETILAWSSNLISWTVLGAIHQLASQPDLRVLPDDSVLYTDEYDPAGTSYVYLAYYGPQPNGQTGLQALLADPATTPTATQVLPVTPGATQDGTPEAGRYAYPTPGTWPTPLEINYHYYWLGYRDLDATGRLTNGTTWAGGPDALTNTLVNNAGGIGKIGRREVFRVGPTVYELVEAQNQPPSNAYGDWRLFLVNRTARTAQALQPTLVGGAQSLGAPTISFLTLPGDQPALALTEFVFSPGNGTTPRGGHLYVYPLP
jgi:hypothetical protein